MTSRAHGSEVALAAEALKRVKARREVLVGGIGLGFTLRAALDRLPRGARVVVAELVPALVAWNRGRSRTSPAARSTTRASASRRATSSSASPRAPAPST